MLPLGSSEPLESPSSSPTLNSFLCRVEDTVLTLPQGKEMVFLVLHGSLSWDTTSSEKTRIWRGETSAQWESRWEAVKGDSPAVAQKGSRIQGSPPTSCCLKLACPSCETSRPAPLGFLEVVVGSQEGTATTGFCEFPGRLPAAGLQGALLTMSPSQPGLKALPAVTGKELEKPDVG